MTSKFKNKFKKQNDVELRKVGTRTEKAVSTDHQLLNFNFKDLDYTQCPPGQTANEWEDKKVLADFIDKLRNLSNMSVTDVQQQGQLTIYDAFPPKSGFKPPKALEGKVKWAVIKKVGGQKGRVAGYVYGNTFYVVFFDKDHKFWITKR